MFALHLLLLSSTGATPSGACSFVTGTATSAGTLMTDGISRTIVLSVQSTEKFETVLFNEAAISSASGLTAIRAGLVGSAAGGWNSVKDELLPDPESLITLAGGLQLLLNLSVLSAAIDADDVTATIPEELLQGQQNPGAITCSNTWAIEGLPVEIGALHSFYNALGGASWDTSTGWLQDMRRHCFWYGVSCDNGTVVGLYLPGNNVAGEVTEALLGLLPDLQHLHLDSNSLSGTLPANLGARLRTLSLAKNSIGGTLPDTWSTSSLENIVLYRNQLTGSIPAAWAGIGTLSSVLLQQNLLDGVLPDWGNPLSASRIPGLRKLWAYGNQLTEIFPDDDRLALQESALPFHPSKTSNHISQLSP
ncbi:putative inactive receptor kinase [Diplonema papillatum]|nr:putative inactive receptor kinase [Diplonema papillatum]